MKIESIKSIINPQFKQNQTKYPKVELERLGYDGYDEDSTNPREFVRWHLVSGLLQEYAKSYGVPTETFKEETDEYAKTLVNKPAIIDYETMYTIPATNVSPIGNNSLRGGYLPDIESVKTAKNAGIKCVIDLTDSRGYKERVEDGGLEYMSYDVDNRNIIGNYDSLVFKDYYFATDSLVDRFDGTEEEFNKKCRVPIENFAKLMERLNKGYCYIGCSSGTHRTDFVMLLYNAFSPMKSTEILKRSDNHILYAFRNLYEKLNDTDKLKMGWDKEFEKTFLSEIEKGFKRTLGFIPR